MKRLLFSLVLVFVCPVAGMAAEAAYPPPPMPGQIVSVDDTVYGVLRTHRNLRGMLENRDVLEHEVDRARAGFGPRVDLTGRAGYGISSTFTTRQAKDDKQLWSTVSYSATLVQPIWDGFAARSRVRSAKSTLESVKNRVFDTATSLSLDGIIAHIDLLRRRTIYDLSVKNVEQHKSVLGMAQERANLGADTQADVSQAQSRLARALSGLSEAKASLHVAEETYTRLTGLPSDSPLQAVTMPPQIFENPESVFLLAEKGNPKLAAYLQDIRALVGDKELAESAFYPTINLEAGPNYSNRNISDQFEQNWQYTFDILGTVRWNIFNSGADWAERKAALARIRQSRQLMYNFIDELKLDVDSTWINYLAAQEQYKHYTKAIEYNKFTRTAYKEQFQLGRRTLLDVLDAESELFNSSTQAETSRGNILVGAYRLCALTGHLLQQMSIDLAPLGHRPPVDANDPREAFAPGWFN
ncbi:MAG: TolC family outer membrane protein [Desulfovibrio sp.]|jgi:adhesin transport system outer membrane protein|nr:TolC family outer membrane protein [Desulfovibrio sp.]